MKILVDIDNTLNNFIEHFIEFARKRDWEIDIEKGSKSFNLGGYFAEVSKDEASSRVSSIMLNSKFWATIPVKTGAKSVLQEMEKDYDVWIVTTLWESHKDNMKEKIKWVSKNFPFFDLDKLKFETDKWTIKADAIVDDKPIVLKKFPGITICFDYPYNEGIDVTHRVKSWEEIKNILL